MGSQLSAAGPGGARTRSKARPVRSGAVPPLADGFSTRPETAPGLVDALRPGGMVALVPRHVTADAARDWPSSCGKTQLAVSFAESLWQSGAVDVLVWVTATSRPSALAGLAEAADAVLGTDPAGDAEAAAARLVAWLGQASRPWLVVFDDLADAAVLDGLWPVGQAGRVLVTAASPAAVPGDRRPLVLPVGAFSTREALAYLMGRLTSDPDQRLGALDLAADLGLEPIALAQASAVIASSAMSCRDYRGYFARRRDQLAAEAGGSPPPAAVTWTLAVEQADRLSPGAAQSALALAALLDGHAIPGAVFATSAACAYIAGDGTGGPPDVQGARGALHSLEQAGLLTIDAAGDEAVVRINSVVQAAAMAAMPQEMLDQAARGAADALLEAWPLDEPQGWHASALRSCAASVQQTAAELLWAGGCHAVLFCAGRSLDSARLTGPALGFWRDLVTLSDRILGPGHPDATAASEHLATAYLAAGQATEAVSWYQRVLAGRARALGPDHPGTLATRAVFGQALMAAGRPDEAIGVLGEVAGDCERVRGSDHTDALSAREELAAAYRSAGRPRDALRLYRRVLAARERVEGPQHPHTMAARQRLADACLADGRLKDALYQYKRALADRERAQGPDDPDTLGVCGALASAYHTARQLKHAIPLYERVLADRERVQGRDHPDTIAVRGNLASAYHSAGRMATALELYEQTRADCERVLGVSHPDTLASRANLAHAYYALGRQAEALALLRDTAALCERVLPPADPLTQAVRESLAAVADG